MLTSMLKTILQLILLISILDLLGKYFLKKTLVGKLIRMVYKDLKFIYRQVLKLIRSVYKFVVTEISDTKQEKPEKKQEEENRDEKKCVNGDSNVIEFSKYHKK